MFYALASHGPMTQLYSQEVWFTKSVALTAISVIMDKQIEPWQHKRKGWFEGFSSHFLCQRRLECYAAKTLLK